jgi:endonuclease YncB( thermonuclease family)
MRRILPQYILLFAALPLLLQTLPPPARAGEAAEQVARLPLERTLSGPIPAIVTRVIDGDTVQVEAQTWLNQSIITSVRINGIDTPELRGKCDDERQKARQARALVESLVPVGSKVTLHHVAAGKYVNRVVADIYDQQGQPIADVLLASQLARPYDGGRRQPWCSGTP